MKNDGLDDRANGHIVIEVDEQSMTALDGQSLAGLMQSRGIWSWRRNAVTGEPRGPYCGMGVCFECELTVDEKPHQRACLVHVADGMRVTTALSAEEEDGELQ